MLQNGLDQGVERRLVLAKSAHHLPDGSQPFKPPQAQVECLLKFVEFLEAVFNLVQVLLREQVIALQIVVEGEKQGKLVVLWGELLRLAAVTDCSRVVFQQAVVFRAVAVELLNGGIKLDGPTY